MAQIRFSFWLLFLFPSVNAGSSPILGQFVKYNNYELPLWHEFEIHWFPPSKAYSEHTQKSTHHSPYIWPISHKGWKTNLSRMRNLPLTEPRCSGVGKSSEFGKLYGQLSTSVSIYSVEKEYHVNI